MPKQSKTPANKQSPSYVSKLFNHIRKKWSEGRRHTNTKETSPHQPSLGFANPAKLQSNKQVKAFFTAATAHFDSIALALKQNQYTGQKKKWFSLLTTLFKESNKAYETLKGPHRNSPALTYLVNFVNWLRSVQDMSSDKREEETKKYIDYLEKFTLNGTFQRNPIIQRVINYTRQLLKKFNLTQTLQQILSQITRQKAHAEASEALCQTEQYYDGT